MGVGIPRFNCEDFPLSAPVALSLKSDHLCVIKQTVKCSFKVIITAEEFKPVVWLLITGKDHAVRAFFFIAPVNHVKKHAGGFSVKYTPADFVYDEARRFYESGDHRILPAVFSRIDELRF